MYLLDTQIVCELRQSTRPDTALVDWLHSVAAPNLYLSASSVGTIQALIEASKETGSKDIYRAQQWLNHVGSSTQVLSLDAATLQLAAVLQHNQKELTWDDAIIAALATYHRLIVVTQRITIFLGLKTLKLDVFDPRG